MVIGWEKGKTKTGSLKPDLPRTDLGVSGAPGSADNRHPGAWEPPGLAPCTRLPAIPPPHLNQVVIGPAIGRNFWGTHRAVKVHPAAPN